MDVRTEEPALSTSFAKSWMIERFPALCVLVSAGAVGAICGASTGAVSTGVSTGAVASSCASWRLASALMLSFTSPSGASVSICSPVTVSKTETAASFLAIAPAWFPLISSPFRTDSIAGASFSASSAVAPAAISCSETEAEGDRGDAAELFFAGPGSYPTRFVTPPIRPERPPTRKS